MKKILVLFCAAALLLTGCASSGGDAPALEPDAAAAAILDNVDFQDTLVKAEDGAAEAFYQIDEQVESYAIYISGSGATAEEIAVLKPNADSSADAMRTILERRVSDLQFQFEDYVPEEMVKLGHPVIVEKGGVVILVLADDPDAAETAIEEL